MNSRPDSVGSRPASRKIWRPGVVVSLLLWLCVSCAQPQPAAGPDNWRKVELDLTQLDAEGLRGPADGKTAVAYEFCIPNTEPCKAQVLAIDASIEFMPGSRGRIGASPQQCLCVGSTHQKNYQQVLRSLANLPFVSRIIECQFE